MVQPQAARAAYSRSRERAELAAAGDRAATDAALAVEQHVVSDDRMSGGTAAVRSDAGRRASPARTTGVGHLRQLDGRGTVGARARTLAACAGLGENDMTRI